MIQLPVEVKGTYHGYQQLVHFGQPIQTQYSNILARLWSTMTPHQLKLEPKQFSYDSRPIPDTSITIAYLDCADLKLARNNYQAAAHIPGSVLVYMSMTWLQEIDAAISSEDLDWFWLLGLAYYAVFVRELALREENKVRLVPLLPSSTDFRAVKC